jgi:predicted DNA-binding protein
MTHTTGARQRQPRGKPGEARQLLCRLPRELVERLRRLAAAEKKTVALVVAEMLRRELPELPASAAASRKDWKTRQE